MKPLSAKEIFDSPAVKAVEIEILDVIMTEELSGNNPQGKISIQHLLSLRKQILNQMFVMTNEFKQLITEFNYKLTDALLEMRQQTITMHNQAKNADLPGVETTGKVFMSYKYPENHPIQTMRAKKIWGVLNNSIDYYQPMYKDGIDHLCISESNDDIPSENQVLYYSEDIDNWNEGLDREMTADMHLCHGFHNLIDHNEFSLFDLLWVRDFNIEITCESSHCTGSEDYDDINWDEMDYND